MPKRRSREFFVGADLEMGVVQLVTQGKKHREALDVTPDAAIRVARNLLEAVEAVRTGVYPEGWERSDEADADKETAE